VTGNASSRNGSKRRKSIELPDLNASLAFTSTTPTTSAATAAHLQNTQTSPTSVKSKSKATVATHNKPVPSSQHGEPLTPTATVPSTASPFFSSSGSGEDSDIYLGSNAQDALDKEIDIDDGARLTPSLRKHADSLSVVPTAAIPAALQSVIKDHTSARSPDPIPLPRNFSLLPLGHSPHQAAAPTQQPYSTIVAPEIPDSVNNQSLGTAAGPTASLIVGSPIGSLSGTPASSPALSTNDMSHSILAPIDTSVPFNHQPSSPIIPLPTAAPIVVLTGSLADNPAAAEAIKTATVDLGAGAEGIPTLLTWTPGEGVGKEGGPETGEGMPKKVYVTGTFAKGWTTKIELRKKKYVYTEEVGVEY